MKLETFQFNTDSGWATQPDGELDSENTLVLVFGSTQFLDNPDAIRSLSTSFPNSHFMGCSTSGEIDGCTVHDDTLSVAVAQFGKTGIATVQWPIQDGEDSFAAGVGIARELLRPDLQGILLLSDGLNVNGSQLVQGMNSVLPDNVIVTGGLAGDGDRFERTWVLAKGSPQSGVISAMGFYGSDVKIGHGSKGGWDIFGPERRVTRSENNVLYELDGKPALALYKEYLGDRAAGLPATALLFPLALREDETSENQIVRTILSVDEEEQSMTFAGDIPQGALVQLMRANFDRLIDGASEAALMTKERCENDDEVLSIAISCVGRRLILGERTEEELEAALDVLPAQTKQVGFYSYGEISPSGLGNCDLHNQTMTLTTITED